MRQVRQYWALGAMVLAAAVMMAVARYYGSSQARSLALVEAHIPKLRQMVEGDPRFSRVDINGFTGFGGVLMLAGTVAGQADRDALVAIVQRSDPPVDVVYRVQIVATTQAVVVLRLDNRGGFSHGGVRIRVLSDGTCERELYSDVPGPGEVQRGTCALDDAAGVLTMSVGVERWELRRIVHEGARYWLDKREVEQIGGPDEAGMWRRSLREVQR